jgi:hypothetical protein
MGLPATIRAGDTVSWSEPAGVSDAGDAISAPTWTGTVYLRTNTASEGATVTGSARSDGGWDFTVSATTSGGFEPGQWYWQLVASYGSAVVTLRTGGLEVLKNLAYANTPGAFDGRSQAEQDLEAVQAAIRAIVSKGAKAYTIGTRSFTAADLGQLMERETQLKSIVAREKAAEKIAAGLGDPRNLFVRFG